MKAAYHPLVPVKERLATVVREMDRGRLQELLAGRYLPALGNDREPAELLFEALTLPPYDRELTQELARLTAQLLSERAASFGEELKSGLSPDQPGWSGVEAATFNLFLLASFMPPEPSLFDGLAAFHGLGERFGLLRGSASRLARQLRQALTYQQFDDRLEDHWLSLIEPATSEPMTLSLERKADLLAAWTGLLWIPPSAEARQNGQTLSVDRVLRGLRALHNATEASSEGLSILRYAVQELGRSYPRSPEFLAGRLGPRLEELPKLLQDVLIERWPSLAEEASSDALIPIEKVTVVQRDLNYQEIFRQIDKLKQVKAKDEFRTQCLRIFEEMSRRRDLAKRS